MAFSTGRYEPVLTVVLVCQGAMKQEVRIDPL